MELIDGGIMKASKERRKMLIKKISEFEQSNSGIKEYIANEYLDENGTAVIEINGYCGLVWFEPLSSGKQLELNSEIYEYIDKKVKGIPINYFIKLKFINSNLSEDKKQRIKNQIKEHYGLILKERNIKLKFNIIKILGLFIFGVLLLAISFALNKSQLGEIVVEILSIIASFSLWEAADFYLFERNQLKFQRLNAGQIAIAEVEFD